ncbi:MAG: hypothetical protein ACLTDR_08515 [Adlercreutzia equolifaciens]
MGHRASSFAADEVISGMRAGRRGTPTLSGALTRWRATRPAQAASRFPNPPGGSVFKNPEGSPAGRLIEAAGCKGAEVGAPACPGCARQLHRATAGGAAAADARSALMEACARRKALASAEDIELARPRCALLGLEADFPAAARGAGDVPWRDASAPMRT